MSRFPFDAYRVYLGLRAAASFLFTLVFTANTIYYVTVVGLDPLQLVLVGTTLEAAVFLFEVPTGIVADVYSRRLSIIIGFGLIGLGFLTEGLIPAFAAVLLSQVLWGTGYTFTSGAMQAWISDEIGEARAGQAFLRGAQAASVGSVAGVIVAILLGSIQINLPIAIGGVLFMLLALVLRAVMPENGFTPAPPAERSSWQHMTRTFGDGLKLVRTRPVLLSILAIGIVYGIASEGYDRLSLKHILDNTTLPGSFEPVVWFGLLSIISTFISMGMQEIARRRVDTNNQMAVAQVAMWLNLMTAAAIFALALTAQFGLAALLLLVIGPLRATSEPIYETWLNQNLEPQVRATVFSMSGQLNALGQIMGGPVVGVIGRVYAVPAALIFSAIIWAAATPIYLHTRRRHPVQPAD